MKKLCLFLAGLIWLAAPAANAWEAFPSLAYDNCLDGISEDADQAEYEKALDKCAATEKARLEAELERLVKIQTDDEKDPDADKEYTQRVAKARAASEEAWKKSMAADAAYMEAIYSGGSGVGSALAELSLDAVSARVDIMRRLIDEEEDEEEGEEQTN